MLGDLLLFGHRLELIEGQTNRILDKPVDAQRVALKSLVPQVQNSRWTAGCRSARSTARLPAPGGWRGITPPQQPLRPPDKCPPGLMRAMTGGIRRDHSARTIRSSAAESSTSRGSGVGSGSGAVAA